MPTLTTWSGESQEKLWRQTAPPPLKPTNFRFVGNPKPKVIQFSFHVSLIKKEKASEAQLVKVIPILAS